MQLRAAGPADVAFIVETEGAPAHERWINRWPAERHLRSLADPDFRYLILERCGASEGFAILAGLTSPNRAIQLVRVALRTPDSGQGRAVCRLLMREAFEHLGAHRLHLDLFEDNARAEHLYAALGFQFEGRLRDAERRGGEFRSLKVMAMIEDDYRRLTAPSGEVEHPPVARSW